MKRILVISPFNPFPPYWGAANRVYNLAKNLSQNHRVYLLCNDHQKLKSESDETFFCPPSMSVHLVKALGRWSQIVNPLLVSKGLRLTRTEKPDLILASLAWSGLHAMIMRLLTGIPYALDEHNVEFVRFRRMGRANALTRALLRLYEGLCCRFAYRVLCVSEVDRELLVSQLKVNTGKVVVVPNGLDEEKFHPDPLRRGEIRDRLGARENTPLMLFCGKLDYPPNREAVEFIAKEVMPRVHEQIPEAKFIVVGDSPPPGFGDTALVFTGMVRDVEDYINASDVVICPLRSGGGTRIKILEAIACGKVVVSTAIGAEGLIGEHTQDFLKVADDWDEFAALAVKAVAEARPSAVPPAFIEKYSWRKAAEEFDKL